MLESEQIGINILHKAESHIGECEQPDGSNSGPDVDRYLAYVGLPPGNPWCAAFACFCVGNVLQEMGLSNPHPCTGSSHELVNWGLQHGKVIAASEARAGDIAAVKGGETVAAENGETYHHTVILADGEGNTIEGNFLNRVNRNCRDLDTLTIIRPY